ncbi:hypothetical protein [Tetragenococcus halophilus]|uniref:hypothetical protein n=1 Tax=Tetragenococcus halophilus TaxID=51669 RepID=UPI000CC3C50B|nr:putative hydrolase [Tetragenococcus halophilus subsp. halophilus]GBD75756.1 putative hydrolase [Tetragenococcus halophilus subsp. halophilus]GFK22027.1 hypothetical protein WJ7_14900 [Tetragenococcus halophilus]GFK24378.1 hypothetical protein YA163_14410 [Tetragenococcus halophilus]GLL51438.1 hypothetical protein YA5_014140 [Tetragenococcus halophilus]
MGKWLQNVKIETSYAKEGEFVSGTNTQLVDLFIENGKVSKIQNHKQVEDGYEKIDGRKYLLLPGIQEMHCHFDKTKLGTNWQPITPANSIIERFTKEIPELNTLELPLSERMKH